VHRLGARAHDHDHPLGLGVSDVVEEMVLTSGPLAESLHRLNHMACARLVEGVDRFASLEEGVRVLRRAADERTVRGHRPVTMGADQVIIDEMP